jgi:steroid delta-isomerase-like uncharacterized protein
MADQDLIRVGRESVEAFSAGDWERFGATLAPESLYQEIGTGRRVQGRDQILEVVQTWKRAFPDAKGTVRNAIASGNNVVLEITWEGTQTGPLPIPGGTIPPSGKRVVVEAVQVLTCEGNKVKENRHHLDAMGLLEQIGAMPAQAMAMGGRTA